MSLDLDRIRKKQKAAQAKSGGNYFKPQEGKNTIRVFAFSHKVTKNDVKAEHFGKKFLGKRVTELDRPVMRVYINNRPVLLKGPNDPLAKKYKDDVGTAYFMNVVDTQQAEKKVVYYAAVKTVYNAILDTILDDDYGEDVLGCSGRDFIIQYYPEKEGASKYRVTVRDEKKSSKLPSSLEKGVMDFYDEETYEKLGTPRPDDDDDDESEDDEDEDTDSEDDDDEDDTEDDDDSDEDDDDLEDEDDDDEDSDEDDDDEDSDDDEEKDPPKKKSKEGKSESKKGKKKH